MGLIGGILQPLYSGIPVTLMPYMMFLQKPFRWLHTISRFHGTVSGGPNFAYDLCVKKITPEQREQLDLSQWEVAFNGAEPVYHKTLDQFAEYFAPCGFRHDAFLPCYGLAESTLLVSGGPKSKSLKKIHLLNSELQKNRVCISSDSNKDTRTVISCGNNQSDQKIKIVNPKTLKPCNSDEVGEIWVSGQSVAKGYWNKPLETDMTFGAQLSDSEGETYLRTGDLGFQKDGEYYITGRTKNLIIAEGKNHYPHDLERTVESSHPAILPGGSAVFSINNDGPERIIVIAEIKHKSYILEDEVIKTIRYAISVYHGLTIDDIRLTNPGAIPRTTSGKKRHFLCREYYIAGTLKEITLT
jgi:acyl-CoA synthetase (AMP-forming)/AMP-acid ligase II